MYTATIEYTFKEDRFDEACEIWEKSVLTLASKQQGFVRMQFLTAPPKALAMGTWQDPSFAQAFMQTGVFKDLLEQLQPMLEGDPRSKIWDLAYFAQA